MFNNKLIAVVIPCYKVNSQIMTIISSIGEEVDRIYVVDDCCPQQTGSYVLENNLDSRVNIIFNDENLGVGGSVMAGYKKAIHDSMDIIVKLDGDGQMDPSLISLFIGPITEGEADYTKGNRFYNIEKLDSMPKIRLLGNAALSFITKFSSGYWNLFDPTNGYTAIHASVLKQMPLKKISKRYFFETDMLFRLNLIQAVVLDIPMDAVYGDESSNLKVHKILFEFFYKNSQNFLKRIFYNYYLRNLSIASIELPVGLALLLFGLIFGCINWVESSDRSIGTPVGTIMLAALSITIGLQLTLSFLAFDISSVPKKVMHKVLSKTYL